MLPVCYPSSPSPTTGLPEAVAYALSSVSGLTRWVDYIPVKLVSGALGVNEQSTNVGGFTPMRLLGSAIGMAAWSDYIPVYVDNSATEAWVTSNTGYIPYAPSGGAAALSPVLNIDLTSTLDSKITFTRAGSRNYLSAGVLTAQASSNVPCFESWDGVNRGMAVEGGFTNLFTYSEDMSQAAWTKTGGAITAGDVGPGLITQMQEYTATATASYHAISRTIAALSSGATHTFSAFIKVGTGSPTNYSAYLHASNEYNNNGALYHMRLDGKDGFYSDNSATPNATGVTYGYRKLSGGIYQVWITGTWTSTGTKQFKVGVTANTAIGNRNYTATTSDKFQVFGCQVAAANGPTGYVATGAATASQAAESAIFNDTSWISTSEGTFVIEHDCRSGPLVGSGANTVLAATVPGKTAIAWSGVTSDTVNNAGAATSSTQPTFSGSDVRLLSTSGASNAGHIKSIKFYNTRLTVAEMQTLTAPTTVSTAVPGSLRTVSVNNRLPSALNTTSGTSLTFSSRFKVQLGGSACSELRLDFPNIGWAASVGNSISITSCALERETGVVEHAPVYVGASRSFTVADNSATTVVSDVILPAAFTGLTEFPANMVFWVRVKGSVTTAGHKIPGGRFSTETGGFAKVYDDAATAYSAVDGTGPMVYVSGTAVGSLTQGYCPILVGKFVSGDPKTVFMVGDSIVEGTGGITGTGTFPRLAAQVLGVPILELSQGGRSQVELQTYLPQWGAYLKYARVLVDEMGTNDSGGVLSFFSYWYTARTTYAYDKIARIGLFPRSSSTDSFATEANQTVSRAYPIVFPDLVAIDWLTYGAIDYNLDPQSVRGTNKAKWIVNGGANYATSDGTHQTSAANDLLAAEFQTFLNAITVT